MRSIAGIIAVSEDPELWLYRRPVLLARREEGKKRAVVVCSRASDVVAPALERVREEDSNRVERFKAGLREFLRRAAAKGVATVVDRWGVEPQRVLEGALPDVEDVLHVLDGVGLQGVRPRVKPLRGPDDPLEFVRRVGRTG